MQTLEDYRNSIDAIDSEILKLIIKRFKIVIDIGKHKREKGLPIVDKKRESKKLEKLTKEAKEHQLSQSFVNTLWTAIFKESRNIE